MHQSPTFDALAATHEDGIAQRVSSNLNQCQNQIPPIAIPDQEFPYYEICNDLVSFNEGLRQMSPEDLHRLVMQLSVADDTDAA